LTFSLSAARRRAALSSVRIAAVIVALIDEGDPLRDVGIEGLCA
jgi:hypothetical protein